MRISLRECNLLELEGRRCSTPVKTKLHLQKKDLDHMLVVVQRD
jgi:hypothetical protein